MIGIESVIVGLWLLPVILFVIVPLTMLIAWMVFKGVEPMLGSSRRIERLENEEAIDQDLFSKARV